MNPEREPIQEPEAKSIGSVIASPQFKTSINVSKEDLEAFNKRRAEHSKRLEGFKIADLRKAWCAPDRHVQSTPQFIGDWGKKFTSLRDELGKGITVALVGERGNGKTQLAVELMRVVTGKVKEALFTTAMGFFINVKTSYRRDAEKTEANIMAEYGRPSLLVIDEIGKRSDTEWENNMLFELLNRRYNDMLDTILICNKAKVDFEEYIGASISSRMNETGGIIQCDWPTFRV